MNTPMDNPPAEPTPPADQDGSKGSLMIGFLAGWAALILGSVLSGGIIYLLSSLDNYGNEFTSLIVGSIFLPLLFLIGAVFWFGVKGQTRSVLGVVLAFVSQIAVVVLLVAACFGYFAVSGGMH